MYDVATLVEAIPDGTRVYARVELIEAPISGIVTTVDTRLAVWVLEGEGPGALARAVWRGTRFLAGRLGDVSYRSVRTEPPVEDCEVPLYGLALEVEGLDVDVTVAEGCRSEIGSFSLGNIQSYQYGRPPGGSCADVQTSYAYGYIVNTTLLTETP